MSLQARYTVTPLGWQWALREGGVLVHVYDDKEEANAAARQLRTRA